MTFFKSLLAHPLTQGLEIDSPETTLHRARIIQEKSFLKQIYQEWYASFASILSAAPEGFVLELGSGAGFLKTYVPNLIPSDIIQISFVDAILDGQSLPFQANTLSGIVMVNVCHHLPQPRIFFSEAARCVRSGGVVVMIEPWVTPWSAFIYGRLHHEPFYCDAEDWTFPRNGPLSGANGALPWIIFERDRLEFEQEFPMWDIRDIQLSMPFRYLISGGVSTRSLMPGWTFAFWLWLENQLQPWMANLAMFARIVLVRKDV